MMDLPVNRLDALDEILRERRSVRGFRPDPVTHAVLDRVFTMAQQAPSNCNVQPWVIHVLSGEVATRLRTGLHDHAASGAEVSPDFPLAGTYPGVYRNRQIGAAKALFAATGVARDDVPARKESFLRNFRFSMRRTRRSFSCLTGRGCARRQIAGCMRNR